MKIRFTFYEKFSDGFLKTKVRINILEIVAPDVENVSDNFWILENISVAEEENVKQILTKVK